ncbi:MAG: hypothetical protein AAB558_01425 [Patescibacteria group bacterium]
MSHEQKPQSTTHVEHKKQTESSAQAHNKHTGHKTQDFLKKFWLVLILTIPILAYSELIEKAFGWNAPHFPGYQWAVLALGSVI